METLLQKKYLFLTVFVLNLIIIGIECKNNKDSSIDLCSKNPCYNGGKCSQTHISPGYKCACSGTGYSGIRCQIKCSSLSPSATVGNNKKQAPTPPECIII